jgi:hypothetical protein
MITERIFEQYANLYAIYNPRISCPVATSSFIDQDPLPTLAPLRLRQHCGAYISNG